MVSVAFVCLGNICRSPMAELIFKNLLDERGLSSDFRVSSFGTSDCEEGSAIYPQAKKTLVMHGIPGSHTARQISLADVKNSDYIMVMDSGNLMDVLRLTGGKYGEKIFKLCSFTASPRDVADPWYTRDFERAYEDILDGCKSFLGYVLNNKSSLYGKKI